MKTLRMGFMAAAVVLTTSCAFARESRSSSDIGPIAIGGAPTDVSRLKSSDCVRMGNADFEDCTAISDDGLRYVFFDGVLAKITARKGEVADSVQFPAGVKLNDQLERALRGFEHRLGIKLSCANREQNKVCASDFVFRSSVGVLYSLELTGDEDGRLVQVVARTDY